MQTETTPNKVNKKSLFKRVNNWLHLWLGLASGIIVVIVCLTGCIWVFNEEITSLTEPELNIEYQAKPVLTPGQLSKIGKQAYPELVPQSAQYQQGKAIKLSMKKPEKEMKRGGPGATLHINPYTGAVIRKKQSDKPKVDFFRFILNGHRALWLPYDIGRPIVDYTTLTFLVILITGLIWWYPKKWTNATRQKSFSIKWGASFKRVNLDLHNVLGFYASLVLLTIAITGIVFGLHWFADGLYWVTSGGKPYADGRKSQSDSTQITRAIDPDLAMDKVWNQVISVNPKSAGFFYNYPNYLNPKSTIGISVYPTVGQFYNRESYTFDQFTLQPIVKTDPFSVPYEKAEFGDKLRKMNYDIHVGSILGLPGKVLAFLSALIGASLPVTGFLVWWGKRNKKKGKAKSNKKERLDLATAR